MCVCVCVRVCVCVCVHRGVCVVRTEKLRQVAACCVCESLTCASSTCCWIISHMDVCTGSTGTSSKSTVMSSHVSPRVQTPKKQSYSEETAAASHERVWPVWEAVVVPGEVWLCVCVCVRARARVRYFPLRLKGQPQFNWAAILFDTEFWFRHFLHNKSPWWSFPVGFSDLMGAAYCLPPQ